MDHSAFDAAARSLGGEVTRRRAMRSLGAAVAGLGITALLGIESTEARRKRGGRKKKRGKGNPIPQAVCPTGQQVGVVSVPANGTAVQTPMLIQGQRYRLRATGFWLSNQTHGQDAFADFEIANPGVSVTTFNGVRLGLSVNGGSADFWGAYNTNHVYERVFTGQGAALSLACSDAVFTDNSGSVQVEVRCA
jgi:hypothetical protein